MPRSARVTSGPQRSTRLDASGRGPSTHSSRPRRGIDACDLVPPSESAVYTHVHGVWRYAVFVEGEGGTIVEVEAGAVVGDGDSGALVVAASSQPYGRNHECDDLETSDPTHG